MKLLILGGTIFVGRHLTEAARARGHKVTLFHRGQHGPGLFPDVETINGDRDGGLDALRGRTWDAVIDTCGYVPRLVRDSAQLLANAVQTYVFISTISVFAGFSQSGQDEHAPLAQLDDPNTETVTGATYGGLKVLCEQEAELALPGRVLTVRPGFIVGPYDSTDRFTYYPVRVAQGGQMLVPSPPETPMQFIDGRDLAEFTLKLLEAGKVGIYNATGPNKPVALGDLLNVCKEVSESNAEFAWADPAFVTDQKLPFPLWIPPANPDTAGLMQVSVAKAVRDGLTFRPLADTVRDTLAWAKTRPADYEWCAGLKPEQESAVLELWEKQNK